MRKTFHHQLDVLDEKFQEMGELARRMLHESLQALAEGDRSMANDVVKRTNELADFDEEIETAALGLIALQAPVAKDLRHVGAVLKLITYINRVGRYGYDIARIVVELPPEGLSRIGVVSIQQMGQNVERMLDLVLEAFKEHRESDESLLMQLENEVDAQRYAVWREAVTYMLQNPRNIEPCSHVMMIARYLERCGDNIVKMAEKLHYAATGERVTLG